MLHYSRRETCACVAAAASRGRVPPDDDLAVFYARACACVCTREREYTATTVYTAWYRPAGAFRENDGGGAPRMIDRRQRCRDSTYCTYLYYTYNMYTQTHEQVRESVCVRVAFNQFRFSTLLYILYSISFVTIYYLDALFPFPRASQLRTVLNDNNIIQRTAYDYIIFCEHTILPSILYWLGNNTGGGTFFWFSCGI